VFSPISPYSYRERGSAMVSLSMYFSMSIYISMCLSVCLSFIHPLFILHIKLFSSSPPVPFLVFFGTLGTSCFYISICFGHHRIILYFLSSFGSCASQRKNLSVYPLKNTFDSNVTIHPSINLPKCQRTGVCSSAHLT